MEMSLELLGLQNHLRDEGLLGQNAVKYGGPDEILLCSSGPCSHLAQFSILCGPPKWRVKIVQPKDIVIPNSHSPLNGEIQVNPNKKKFTAIVEEWKHGCWYHSTSIFAQSIDEMLNKLRTLTPDALFENQPDSSLPQRPFWAGALSYDMVQWTQPINLQHPPDEEELLTVLWLIEKMVVQDRKTEKMTVYSLIDDSWSAKILDYVNKNHPLPELGEPAFTQDSSSMTDTQHERIIEDIRESIRSGQMYQVNVGRWWDGELNEHPRRIFQRLTISNPAPFSAYIDAPDLNISIVCSSPESLLKCDEENVFTSPIKGTRPRGTTDAEELLLRNEMVEDEKERSEHRMLVDLMRNDIAHVSKVGSIAIKRFDVEAYAQVQHLVSHLSGKFDDKMNGIDAIQNVFPGGSITGCPRTVVCAAIDEVERRPRSFWTGSLGWVDVHSGSCALNIMIRTLIAKKRRYGWSGSIAAGGGITIGSIPRAEVNEAKWKAAALRRACGWIENSDSTLPTRKLTNHPLEIEEAPMTSAHGSVQFVHESIPTINGILLIDNLDSFTLNIAHAVAGLGHDVSILKARDYVSEKPWNADSAAKLVNRLKPSHVILGPGPGKPDDSPLTLAIAKASLQSLIPQPVMGICLGHQAIGLAAGMTVDRSVHGPVHGVPRSCLHSDSRIFSGIQSPSMFTRYNSLSVSNVKDTGIFDITYEESTNEIMTLEHKSLPICGVQFHPESVGSKDGLKLLDNFLQFEADA